jgi:hypothetical protein
MKLNRHERRSIEILESCGYRCSRLAGGLGDFHVIGIGSTDAVLLLVKSRKPDPSELENLKNICRPANFRKLVHVWSRYAHFPGTIELP